MLYGKAERAAIHKAVEKGWWPLAQEGRKMELEAAKYLGVKYGILANSGSSAGLLALCALELPRDSEVIIPATTFPTIFNIILQCNLTPVVVDSYVGTYNLDPDQIEKAITKKTKAIICVHAVGNPVDLVKLHRITKKHNLVLILDNCDGFGTNLHGKKVETYADISFTSFHAAHIVSMGQGGGVFTNDKKIAQNVRMYRDWGRQANLTSRTNTKWKTLPKDYDSRFIYEKIGYNLSPLELQAAMGRVQLKRTEMIKRYRKRNFDYLHKNLDKFYDLVMPYWIVGADPSWFAFPLSTLGKRGPLVAFLEKHGIETRSMFAGNITKHPAYKNTKYRKMPTPEADWILEHSFWIGVHPRYGKKDLDYVISVFAKYYAQITTNNSRGSDRIEISRA